MSKKMPNTTIERLQQQTAKRHKKVAQLKRKREKELNILTDKIRREKSKNLKNAIFIPKGKDEFEEQFFKANGMTIQDFNAGKKRSDIK